MVVTVEFFDVPRRRAGTGRAALEIGADEVSFSDVLQILAERFPALAATCFEGRRLRPGYLASIDGKSFLADPESRLRAGDALLIMSIHAGG